MPFYDYRCTVCGHEFDDMKSVSDPNPPCPNELEHRDASGEFDGMYQCGGPTVKIPSKPSPPLGGPTPIHYPNRGVRK